MTPHFSLHAGSMSQHCDKEYLREQEYNVLQVKYKG